MLTIHWTLDDDNRLAVAWAEEQMTGLTLCEAIGTAARQGMERTQSAPAKARNASLSFFETVCAFLNKPLTPLWKA